MSIWIASTPVRLTEATSESSSANSKAAILAEIAAIYRYMTLRRECHGESITADGIVNLQPISGEIEMKFLNADVQSQIEKVASTEVSRYTSSHVFFSVEKCHLVATNGHALAVVHVVPEEGDITGWITTPALQAWRKAVTAAKYNKHLVKLQALEKSLVITDGQGNTQTLDRPSYSKGAFPNYEAVFPIEVADKPAFTLDYKLLVKLVEALGPVETLTGKSSMVAVFPSKDNRSPHLVKTSMNGPIGIIMPVRADDEKANWLTSLEAVDAHFHLQIGKVKEKAESEAAEKAKEAEREAALRAAGKGETKATGKVFVTEDGYKFYEYENGVYGDHEDPAQADQMYESFEELNDCEGVTEMQAEAEPAPEPVYEASEERELAEVISISEAPVPAEDESQETAETEAKPAPKTKGRTKKTKAA